MASTTSEKDETQSSSKISFLPVSPPGYRFDVEGRVKHLREVALKNPTFKRQQSNILFVIHLYESGQLKDPTGKGIVICNGKMIEALPELSEWTKDTVVWHEVKLWIILYFSSHSPDHRGKLYK